MNTLVSGAGALARLARSTKQVLLESDIAHKGGCVGRTLSSDALDLALGPQKSDDLVIGALNQGRPTRMSDSHVAGGQ